VAQAAEKKKKPTRKAAPNTSFEYRFSDDLKQTADSEARLDRWFRDAKFGAFIHFGVYSSLEGEYQGRGSDFRYSEWIQISAKIPASEYHGIAAQFNPAEFDADEWAKVFKDAGMRYVVITSKHHDGFALFDSLVSQYNIVDYTPFKRDIIKELSEACHAQGLKFGVYYSNAQDWDEPDAPYLNRRAKLSDIHPDLPVDFKPDMGRYIAKKSLPQVEELMTNYEIDLIWYDTPVGMNMERVKRFSDMVRKHRPDCLINSRIIHRGKGKIEAQYLPYYDYCSIGDKEVPTKKLPLYVESPDSVSSSFGYKTKGKHYYHTEKELIDRLVHTVCAGGNYLLNNGPMGNGRLDPEAMRLYGVLGKWLKVNGESIYDTRRNPLPGRLQWGDCSASKDGRTLYLHILDWPESGGITVSDLPANVAGAIYLANGTEAAYICRGNTVTFTLPAKALDDYNTVIKVLLSDDPVSRAGSCDNEKIAVSSFCESLVPGKFILKAKEGWWNWGMAPIYDEKGKLHIFNSSIPFKGEKGMGYWQTKSIINHYVADSVEGPYRFLGTVFSSDEATYHNPQISRVGNTYVLVFLWKKATKGAMQSIGIATAKSLHGPWTESPLNPIIRPSRVPGSPNATHASNPSFLVDREGKYRIYYKSISDRKPALRTISLAMADRIEGPYRDHPNNPLITYEELGIDIEDPYAFFYQDTYHMIVEDRMGVRAALEGRPTSPDQIKPGGNRPGLIYQSTDGIHWGRPQIGYMTNAHYFGQALSRTERPHILWKDGHPEYLFLANKDSREAGFYLKIDGWTAAVPSYLRGYEDLYAKNPRKAAKQWFDDADFGLFIHYGLYSLAEGYWGEVHSRPAEWLQLRAKIPVKEYAKLADRFTAENFDADFITDLALDAGMKYINITTRHHDSFCLFDSKYTDFKSTNSAAKRDLIAELAEQCQKKRLGLFLYYSHGRDWRHAHAPNNDEWDAAARPKYDPSEASYKYGDEHDLNLYVEFMKNQITELLTNYGPVAGIWLDGRGVLRSRPDATDKFKLQALYDHIHSLQPQVLVSYKQGLLGTEDFRAPERHYQREGNELLEICNTMQPYAWGYDRDNDVGHKTPDEVMEMLAHTKEMNANLLLNIGPLPDGTVFPDDVTSLREVGRRLKAAQTGLDLVYEYVGLAVQQKGTHVWGTSPVIGKDGKTHLFVAQWPIPKDKKERFSGYYKTSEIAQYVGDSPEGPFEFVRMAVRDQDGTFNAPHNPTIQFIGDQYVLCFIVNSNEDRGTQRIIMYVADDPNGEWRPARGAESDGTILRRPDDTSIWCHNSVRGVANPALLKHNGEYHIYFKAAIPDPEKEPSFSNREFGYGVATSQTLEGPYQFHHERLTSQEMELEDVYAFSYDDRVYMLSRDIGATLGGKEGGLLWESKDGIHFPKEKTTRAFESLATYLDEGALDGAAKYRGSEKGQLERPQMLIVDGEPAYLYVATGLSPEEGFGSCSHVFKLNVK